MTPFGDGNIGGGGNLGHFDGDIVQVMRINYTNIISSHCARS